jgi:hypothetical protein
VATQACTCTIPPRQKVDVMQWHWLVLPLHHCIYLPHGNKYNTILYSVWRWLGGFYYNIGSCAQLVRERAEFARERWDNLFWGIIFVSAGKHPPTNYFWWSQIQVDPTYLVVNVLLPLLLRVKKKMRNTHEKMRINCVLDALFSPLVLVQSR